VVNRYSEEDDPFQAWCEKKGIAIASAPAHDKLSFVRQRINAALSQYDSTRFAQKVLIPPTAVGGFIQVLSKTLTNQRDTNPANGSWRMVQVGSIYQQPTNK